MRIAVFSDCYLPAINGVVTSITQQLEILRELGHHVDLICPQYPEQAPDEPDLIRLWARPFVFHKREQMTLPWPPRAVKTLWRSEYDVVHLQTPFSVGMLGLCMAELRGLPKVFHHHTLWEEYVDYLPLPKGLTSYLSVAVCRTVANRCQRVVAPSAEVEERFREQGVRVPMDVVPTGIRPSVFQGGSARPELGPEDQVCLYIGRLAFEKSIDAVLRVFQKIHEGRPHSRMWLVGDGPARKALEQLSAELGLAEVVTFFGFVPRTSLRDFIASSRLFLFSSLTETQGLVLLEAQAGGLPVVAFEASGVNEAVEPGETGYLVEVGREDLMASAAGRLLDESELWESFSRKAVSWAEKFSVTRMGEQLVCLYEKAINSAQTREK